MCSLQGILDAIGGVNKCFMILRLHILLHLIHKSHFEVCIGVYLFVFSKDPDCENIEVRLYIEFPAVMWSFCKKIYFHRRCDQHKF